MDEKKLKELIKIAKSAVEGEDEPYKSEGFRIILNKLLTNDQKKIETTELPETPKLDLDRKIHDFCKKCEITMEQFNETFFINNENVEIIAPIKGTNVEKQLIVAICILVVSELVLDKEWLQSTKIAECLRSIGMTGLANLSFTLKRHSNLIRSRGSRGLGKEYKLTSSEGRSAAFHIIRKISQAEQSTL